MSQPSTSAQAGHGHSHQTRGQLHEEARLLSQHNKNINRHSREFMIMGYSYTFAR